MSRRALLALRLCPAATLALPAGAASMASAMGIADVPRSNVEHGASLRRAPPFRASSVVVAFAPPSAHPSVAPVSAPEAQEDAFQRGLARLRGVSTAIMSATQGSYTQGQLLLDITQGARVASSAYPRAQPPAMSLAASGSGGAIEGFATARRRAEDAPQLLRPGLLAARMPGGAGYAAVTGSSHFDAVAGADRSGRVASVSLGSASTLLARISALRAVKRLVIVDLPAGTEGYEDLRSLAGQRSVGEILLVIQRASAPRRHELLWMAAGGLAQGRRDTTLSSASTAQRGLVSAVDIAPTILTALGLAPPPADMRGEPIHVDGVASPSGLRALMARLRVIGERRIGALEWLLGAWALLVLLCAPWPSARALATRAGALGVLWMSAVSLVPAALEPSTAVEYAMIAAGCLCAGALTDATLAWPRAPLAPATVTLLALTVDALAGTQLLMRSLLGPDPALGARFYGIGNELKSGLAVLALAAVAGAVYPVRCPSPEEPDTGVEASGGSRRPRRLAESSRRRTAIAAMTGMGVVLAAIEGSARIGAGVGSVILVSAGFAVAIVVLLPGALTRKRLLIVLGAPLVALAALAALDLATAHGTGHYTGSILHARSAGDLRDVIVRRYRAAWDELHNRAIPYLTALSLTAAALGLRYRQRVLSTVSYDPAWQAAFAGGLTAGVVGALVEDSGPLLLVVAALALSCVLAYLRAPPARDLPQAADRAKVKSPPVTRPAASV